MQVLLGSNFSPVKASYKIKRKKLASDIENLPKVEKPSVSLQDPNAPLSLNTKRLPLQSIDEIAKGTLETVNSSQKEANYPSSQTNNRKKVHTGKEQNTLPTAQTKIASFENTSKIPHTQPQHQNSLTPKPIISQVTTVQRQGPPRAYAPQTNSFKENRNESLGTLHQKNREIPNPASTWRKETVNINVEEAMRNKMKYLPHVQLKEAKYGNHFVPVLPSFLIRDN